MALTKQDIISNQQHEIEALRRYVHDLKYRHDRAINTLGELAEGRGLAEDGKISMSMLARIRLVEIAKMALRETP